MIRGSVYKITCIVNNKKYIGSSINPLTRKASHFCQLRKNNHHSKKLQNSFNLYGEINFIFEIIEDDIDQSDIFIKEQYWIDYYNSYNEGLNCRKDAAPALIGELNGMFGKKERKIGFNSHLRKPIISYCIDTGEIIEYESVRHAGSIVGGTQFIAQMKNPFKRKKFNNKFWFYLPDFNLDNLKIRFEILLIPHHSKGVKLTDERKRKISLSSSGRRHSEESKKKISEIQLKSGKKIIRSDGQIFNSASEAAREMKCSCAPIYKHLKKPDIGYKTIKGFTFEYLS